MASHSWSPMFRMVPADGAEETLDVNATFTDASGPVKTEVGHKPEQTKRTDINRNARATTWGFRAFAKFDFDLISTEHHEYFATLLQRFLDRDAWTIYLSMNGGIDWREVELVSYDGPKPLGGKRYVGAGYGLDVQAVEIDTVPPLGTGRW